MSHEGIAENSGVAEAYIISKYSVMLHNGLRPVNIRAKAKTRSSVLKALINPSFGHLNEDII